MEILGKTRVVVKDGKVVEVGMPLIQQCPLWKKVSGTEIITSCASGNIRDMVKPLIQVGTAIPLFGLTEQGKEILIERAKKIQAPLLISTMDLPVLDKKKQPGSLVY